MLKRNELSKSQLLNQQRFFNAAEKLFERHGYQKTTIVDICKAADLSKPTFYGLFRDKAELFVMLMMDISEKAITEWEASIPEGKNPLQRLQSFIDFYDRILVKKTIFRLIFEDQQIIHKFAWIIYSTPHSPVLTSLKQILQDGVESGHFRRFDPDAVLWMIYALLDSMWLMVPMLTNKPGAGDDPMLAKEVKKFILNGVGVHNEK